MKRFIRKSVSASLALVLVIQVISGLSGCSRTKTGATGYDGTTDQGILILVNGDASASSELSLIKNPLDRWGYSVEVFDHTEHYHLVNSDDRWYLEDQGDGHGDLDLVLDGDMKYRVVIFDSGDGVAYADIETPARSVKQMFQQYPFLGIVRMERGCTSNGSLNNVFQVGTSGGAAKDLTMSNPTGSWALEPLRGYQRSMTSWGALNISAKTSDVEVLESFGDGTPAITVANYSSGARAAYFAFKDWGYPPHVSMLVRLIQEYSGMPYLKPYYSLEIDDCGVPETVNEGYISLINWTKSNFGGYPTFAFMEYLLDPDPPANIMVYGQNPSQYFNNTLFNPSNLELMATLRSYEDYIVASHGYQHDIDWWKWSATGIPVDPYSDQDSDGIENWLDWDIDGDGVNNNADSDLALYSGGAFIEPDQGMQECWFSRMREVLDLYGYSDTHVFITTKFEYLDGYTNELAGKYGFTVVSGKPATPGYEMTLGWVNDTYVPGRMAPSDEGSTADVALDSAEQILFSRNFMGYIGGYPVCLITNHLWQYDEGDTPGYELRDSYLSSYGVMRTAGFDLVSTQTAANKNIGWLWTKMSSTQDSSENIDLTLDSSSFLDGKARHELDIVLPFSIKEVKNGDNYWIYVDDQNLYYGKRSNSTETLQILKGSYNSTLPRISSVSTPATDVLNATYDPASGRVSLMLDGTFSTRVEVRNFNRPFSQGTTSIDSNGNSALTISLAGETFSESVNMSVVPSSDSVDIVVQAWHISGTCYRKWTESSSTSTIVTAHVVGDLSPGKYYAIWCTKDGGTRTHLQTLQANSSGQISFTYDGGYSSVLFEVEEEA